MVIALYYKSIYLLIVTICTIFCYFKYKAAGERIVADNVTPTILLAIFLTVFIGIRPVHTIFADMVGYADYNQYIKNIKFHFDTDTENLLFDNYLAWVGSMKLGTEFFFTTIAAVYFGAAYIGIRKMFPNDTLVAYLVFLGAFSTFSYATNGIKAGAAASLFIMAIAYRENLKVCIPLVLLTYGFHHSMMLPIAAFFLTLVYRKPKVYFVAWCVCVVIAAAHITIFQELFANISADTMADEHGARYLRADSSVVYLTGFRLDFVLYSSMPVLVGYWAMYKKNLVMSKFYTCLLNLYLCTNGIWMMCMYASFTNRIAYLSWFLYPVVLIYPFLNEDWGPSRYRTFAKVAFLHLAFTLFMEVVYYA